jgi:hypothetical protein
MYMQAVDLPMLVNDGGKLLQTELKVKGGDPVAGCITGVACTVERVPN